MEHVVHSRTACSLYGYDDHGCSQGSVQNGALCPVPFKQTPEREARSRGSSVEEQLFAFSHHLLAHADEHRDIFPAMVSKRGGALIQHLLRHVLVKVVRDDVKSMASRRGAGQVPEEAIVQFIAGGLFGLLMWWLGCRMRLSVEELNEIFRRLAIPAVKSTLP